jgi:hypothetical protein
MSSLTVEPWMDKQSMKDNLVLAVIAMSKDLVAS